MWPFSRKPDDLPQPDPRIDQLDTTMRQSEQRIIQEIQQLRVAPELAQLPAKVDALQRQMTALLQTDIQHMPLKIDYVETQLHQLTQLVTKLSPVTSPGDKKSIIERVHACLASAHAALNALEQEHAAWLGELHRTLHESQRLHAVLGGSISDSMGQVSPAMPGSDGEAHTTEG